MVNYASDTRQEKNSEVGNELLLKSIDENCMNVYLRVPYNVDEHKNIQHTSNQNK